jgi:integrase/recombinase XerC
MYREKYCSPAIPSKKPEINTGRPIPLIQDAINCYLALLSKSRSENTSSTYKTGMSAFTLFLIQYGIDPHKESVLSINEDVFDAFLSRKRTFAISTENVYVTSVMGFYEFIYMKYQTRFDIAVIYLSKKWRLQKVPERVIIFPYGRIVEFLKTMGQLRSEEITPYERLRDLRDFCFIRLLAESGLRVNEACHIQLGGIDFENHSIHVGGKGSRVMKAILTKNVRNAIIAYLQARGLMNEDGKLSENTENLYLFAKHNINTKYIPALEAEQISSQTGEDIVKKWVTKVLGQAQAVLITPHSFRHFFITRVYEITKDLLLTKSLANHKSTKSTERYIHLQFQMIESTLEEGI